MINKKAAEIHTLARNNKETARLILQILAVIEDDSAEKVLEAYNKVMSGETKVAEVTAIKELTASQKTKIEELVVKEIGMKPTFIYKVNKSILGGFVVKIDDNVLDQSLAKKIRELEIN